LRADATEGRLRTHGPVGDLVDALVARGADPVLLDDWRAIDAAEIALGATHGRARTTMHERDSLLAAVRAAAARTR
jgi:ferredoxin--NADP+ reductase